MLNINKFNYPFTLKQKSFLENFFKFAPPYIQTVLMLRSYKKGSRLVAAGDSCAHVYILLKAVWKRLRNMWQIYLIILRRYVLWT